CATTSASGSPMTLVTEPRTLHPLRAEVISALVSMGWRASEAEQAVAEIPATPGDTLEGLLRQALRSMPR
ncbi:MAG TPA: RuvA C-terminal domain-containing protein, partial [Kofleriaceae bacterium]|nr:RuvA C-terminal domain-containing protein [Kofleriaceae bacterium]